MTDSTLKNMAPVNRLIGYARSADGLLIGREDDECLARWVKGLEEAAEKAAEAVDKLYEVENDR